MQVVHTAEVPPNHGRICLAMIGWTRNSRNADSAMVRATSGIGKVVRASARFSARRGQRLPRAGEQPDDVGGQRNEIEAARRVAARLGGAAGEDAGGLALLLAAAATRSIACCTSG